MTVTGTGSGGASGAGEAGFVGGRSCEKCGGFIGETGKSYGYAGKVCHCGWTINKIFQNIKSNVGWLCPECKKVHSPTTAYCNCLIQER
jgi:hypothetical protein